MSEIEDLKKLADQVGKAWEAEAKEILGEVKPEVKAIIDEEKPRGAEFLKEVAKARLAGNEQMVDDLAIGLESVRRTLEQRLALAGRDMMEAQRELFAEKAVTILRGAAAVFGLKLPSFGG